MSLVRLFTKRLLLGLLAAWAVLTTVFGLFALTDDWVLQARVGLLKWASAEEEVISAARESYFSARGLNQPVYERYVGWLADMLTLQWGQSFVTDEAVLSMVADAAVRTGMYVLPALVIALTLGVAIGLYAALRPDSRLANTGRIGTYALFAVPGFWIGGLALSMTYTDILPRSPLVFDHLFPIALTTMALLGGYVSYARSHSLEYVSSEFVKLVRAKGGSPREVARHVVRNAAIPLFSMVFTEALALLVLTVFVVESLFGIEGFGSLLIDAVDQRDIPVMLGGTMAIIAVGVGGNIVQDFSYSVLDPRVDTGSR